MAKMGVEEPQSEGPEECHRTPVHHPNQRDDDSTGITEELSPARHWRRPNLCLDIPPKTSDDTTLNYVRIKMPPTPSPMKEISSSMLSPTSTRVPMSPGPSTSKGKPSIKSLLSRVSFKFRSTPDVEKAGGSSTGSWEGPRIPRSFSLTKLLTPTMRKTSSLPVTPVHSNPETVHGSNMVEQLSSLKNGARKQMSRSLSVPASANAKTRGIRGVDYFGGLIRVIPSTPRIVGGSGTTFDIAPKVEVENSDGDEEIPEGEAVCRICLVELGEGETLKMECSCKGELALAHQECAIKWFSLKGNKNCEVCKEEVRNLPVTLLRVQNVQNTSRHAGERVRQMSYYRYRVWQDVPVLIIVGMLAYFCFLEQLLVHDLGSGAIAISLPFSCVLGLLASMTSSTIVRKRFVWIYAVIQFVLVVLFAHMFYSLFHVQPVLSVLLATFAGFGVAMCGNCLVTEFFKWRQQNLLERHQNSQEVQQQAQASDTPQPQLGIADNNETRAENSGPSRESAILNI
ncbi:hypothetical protein AAC387_Pa12g1542 [Persea americana]